MVVGDGFEPPNPKEQIYSLPRLASSLPIHILYTSNVVLIYSTIKENKMQYLFFIFFTFFPQVFFSPYTCVRDI